MAPNSSVEVRPDRPKALDLSNAAVFAYLQSIGARPSKILRQMEHVEDWPSDNDPGVMVALQAFCETISEHDLQRLASEPDGMLAELLAHLRASRCFLFLDKLTSLSDQSAPGGGDVIDGLRDAALKDSDAERAFHVCVARLAHLQRSECLQRVYGVERARRISAALMEVS